MTNSNQLKIAMLKSGLTAREFAAKIDCSYETLSLKMNNKRQFTQKEIQEAFIVLGLTYQELYEIFFNKEY